MRRAFWTVGVALAGFVIGGIGAGNPGSAIGALWGATAGFGFGSIFSQSTRTKAAIGYWAITLGIVGPFFGLVIGAGVQPYASSLQEILHGTIGAVVGALLGAFIGFARFKRVSPADPEAEHGAHE
jgi:hypothetical protein